MRIFTCDNGRRDHGRRDHGSTTPLATAAHDAVVVCTDSGNDMEFVYSV